MALIVATTSAFDNIFLLNLHLDNIYADDFFETFEFFDDNTNSLLAADYLQVWPGRYLRPFSPSPVKYF